MDKIGVSIDSEIADQHDTFRSKKGSFQKTLSAIKGAKKAGIRVITSTVITHQNIYQPSLDSLIQLSEDLGVGLELQCATVAGGWQANTESLLTSKTPLSWRVLGRNILS